MRIGGKNQDCRKAINGHLARGKSAVFWQTGQGLPVFSTGNEKKGITVFSGRGPDTKTGKRSPIRGYFTVGDPDLLDPGVLRRGIAGGWILKKRTLIGAPPLAAWASPKDINIR